MSSMDQNPIRLTQTVQKGGCAAKLPAGELRKILGSLPLKKDPRLLVGTETLDDACIWDLGSQEDSVLIQTLDFFTPIVDDAYDFGAIAAANALSDVFAMGGQPATAMSILAFPSRTLPFDLLKPLMEGALDKIHEAGAVLAGGHTIDDETLKLGFSVSGFAKKSRVWKNAGAREGDVLILTKALGTGTITTALKLSEARPESVKAAIASMKQLNSAPELLADLPISAATDITGFGLAGHAAQMAQASGVNFEIDLQQLPVLPGAIELLQAEYLNRAHATNWTYVEPFTEYKSATQAASEALKWLTVDPQTSGGLLLSVPEQFASQVILRLAEQFPSSRVIGKVRARTTAQEFRPTDILMKYADRKVLAFR